jgi:ubiquinone/menaquinone biosynthesis C-methylase UbiE
LNRSIVPATGCRAFLRFYDPLVSVFARQKICHQHILDQTLRALATTERMPVHVLDVGCGTGTLALALAEHDRLSVRGLDADPQILAQAVQKNLATPETIEWMLGNATEVPLPDTSIDIVVCSLVFHHLTLNEKRHALQEVWRVLVPGGILMLLDYARPRNVLAHCLFLPVRILDGWNRTRCNVSGRLPNLIREAGFETPTETLVMPSLLGTIRCYQADKPTS